MNSFFKGLLFGAGVGGASGLFFAPKKGKELQKEIDNYVVELTESNQQFQTDLKALRSSVKETARQLSTTLPELQSSIKKEMESYKFQTDVRMSRVKEQLSVLKEHLEDSQKDLQK